MGRWLVVDAWVVGARVVGGWWLVLGWLVPEQGVRVATVLVMHGEVVARVLVVHGSHRLPKPQLSSRSE